MSNRFVSSPNSAVVFAGSSCVTYRSRPAAPFAFLAEGVAKVAAGLGCFFGQQKLGVKPSSGPHPTLLCSGPAKAVFFRPLNSHVRALLMEYLRLFQMPTVMKITGRSSSITNAFINSIIPVVPPSAQEVKEAFEILGMTPQNFQCAYCGAAASEWDHLRPLVKDRKPTGYISEIHNLVPSCGKCNQSKGNKDWRLWMVSKATLSPTTRGVEDIAERMRRLEAYESWREPTKMDFEAIVGNDLWLKHWQNLDRLQVLMQESQEVAAKINAKVASAYKTL